MFVSSPTLTTCPTPPHLAPHRTHRFVLPHTLFAGQSYSDRQWTDIVKKETTWRISDDVYPNPHFEHNKGWFETMNDACVGTAHLPTPTTLPPIRARFCLHTTPPPACLSFSLLPPRTLYYHAALRAWRALFALRAAPCVRVLRYRVIELHYTHTTTLHSFHSRRQPRARTPRIAASSAACYCATALSRALYAHAHPPFPLPILLFPVHSLWTSSRI